ncbi:MAG: hypothetical protein JWN02_1232, partial [Acidobacteria bacterium]|nr:hypothetical protein [Acidobacteriota bacterium]
IASPPGMLLREVDFPAEVLQKAAADGSVSRMTVGRFAVDLFVIRPGSGIWATALRDGDATDVDHAEDGTLTAETGQVPSVVTGQPALDRIQPGDVVFVVDRNSFQFFAARIPN